jgi:endoglucanase
VGSPLTAEYKTETVRLGGYRGVVTVTNPGQTPITGWTVVISLPVLNLTVRDPAGAEYHQTGQSVTFTPSADTRVVRPGAGVLFSFEVDGVGKPTACAIDGRPCSGISD